MEKMINTHEKLLKEFMDFNGLHRFLKEKGYDKGEFYLIDALYFAIRETDLYLVEGNLCEEEQLSEEEYFEMLIKYMNNII